MAKWIVSFYSDLEELCHKRANSAIRSILTVLDLLDLEEEHKAKMRKIILDEINSMKLDFLDYFFRSKNGV